MKPVDVAALHKALDVIEALRLEGLKILSPPPAPVLKLGERCPYQEVRLQDSPFVSAHSDGKHMWVCLTDEDDKQFFLHPRQCIALIDALIELSDKTGWDPEDSDDEARHAIRDRIIALKSVSSP